MSGNSTRSGIALGKGNIDYALQGGSIILLFICGVVAGTIVAAYHERRGRQFVLAFVSLCLAIAAMGQNFGATSITIAAAAVAMGAENAVFQREGEIAVALTYVTGALVKLGQQIAGILTRRESNPWLPYAMLWLALVAGASLGSVLFAWHRESSLWIAVMVSAALAAIPPRAMSAPSK